MTKPMSNGWHKSSYSGTNNDCVEHKSFTDGTEKFRDSKDVSIAPVAVSRDAYLAFIGFAKTQQV